MWPGVLDFVRVIPDLHVFRFTQYPAYDSFLESIEVEAEQNVKRLRHHPSIVIFGESQSSYRSLEVYSPQS